MGRGNPFRSVFFIKAPAFADPDKALLARQVFVIVRAFVVSSVLLQFVLLAFDPRITPRWLALLLSTVVVSVALLALNRRGDVRAAAALMVVSLWLLIGLFAWTHSGLGTRAAWGYFIVVFIAGMMLGKWPGIITAGICSASTLFIALEAPMVSSDPIRFWLINSLFLLVVLLLQDLAARSIRESLSLVHSELRERQLAEDELLKSESRFKSIVESSPMGMHLYELLGDDHLVFIGANQAADKILGVDNQRFIGKTIEEAFPPLLNTEVPERYRDVARTGSLWKTEQVSYEDRSIKGAFDVVAFQVSAGKMVALFTDISERKRAEEVLLERNRFISSLLRAIPVAVFFKDKDGRYTGCNDAFTKIMGVTSDEIKGKTVYEVWPGELAETYHQKDLELMKERKHQEYEFQVKDKHGRLRPVIYAKDVYFDAQGEVGGLVGAFLDISERKLGEEKLLESERRYRTLFESSSDGILLLHGTHLIDCNVKILELFGCTREQIANISQTQLSPEKQPDGSNSREKAMEKFRAALAGHPQRFDWIYLKGDGTPFPAEVSLNNVELGSGTHLLVLIRNIAERKQGEQKLLESERRYRTLFESAGDAIFILRGDRIVDCNSRTQEMFGAAREQIIGLPISRFHPSRQPDGSDSLARGREKNAAARNGESQFFEWRHVRFDGSSFDAEVSLNRVELGSGVHLLAMVRDVSERRKLEEQLLQAQKMEAVGILAGGVAHDFNNILSTIVGYGSLLQMKLPEQEPLKGYIERILAASERAASLTGSLLAFSRKQEVELQPLNINDAIYGFHEVLARLIGEDIDFSLNLASEGLVVDVDARQFEQVLMNLVNNSRDAMPQGGWLTIATSAVTLDADSGGIPRGSYAAIAVADSGTGMEQAVQFRIFEPFFTTKEVGKGTGLGLAIVYGIVKKHKGYIGVESVPGSGTKFTVYLPLQSTMKGSKQHRKPEPIPTGSETILLVEDDPAVRQVTRSMLEEFGYTVLEATDGVSAQYVFQEHGRRIDLVVCDLLMPRLNGRETLAGLRKMKEGIPAIFISGYTADIIAEKGLADSGIHLLMKPLNPGVLLKKVRAVLDEG